MRLSHATRYAVAALVHLARVPPGSRVMSQDIARAHCIPRRFLLNTIKRLVAAGILHSHRGHYGGYVLARPLRDVTLLKVVEAVDGPIRSDAAAAGEGDELRGRLQQACDRAAEAVRGVLGKVRLADLAKR